MTFRQRIRTALGAVAVLTLLALIVLDTAYSGISLSLEDKALLTSLIAALLGLDLALNQLPISIEGGNGGGKNGK